MSKTSKITKCNLNKEYIVNVIQNTLRQYPNITYEINTSTTTLSVYTIIYYNNSQYVIRISDHGTSQKIRSITISKTTQKKTLVAFINNTVKLLKNRSINNSFKLVDLEQLTII